MGRQENEPGGLDWRRLDPDLLGMRADTGVMREP